MFYLQRCGVELDEKHAGVFAHPACHTALARTLDTDDWRDVGGGWHDAGDYGRYVVPAAKAVVDLLLAYCRAPGAFSDDTNIPKAETASRTFWMKYDLSWNGCFKMQTQSGGVNHKVTCAKFPGFVMPEKETQELLLSPVSTCATADFCGALALASRVYAHLDPAFARACLNAAKRADAYLERTPFACFYNPGGIETGQYEDTDDADERYFAACALLYATGEPRYHEAVRKLANPAFADGLGWEDMGGYGNALYLMANETDTDPSLRMRIQCDLVAAADRLVALCEQNGYFVSLTRYRWGSNMYLLNHAMLLLMANDIQPNETYLRAAAAHADYLFGVNPMSICYVTRSGGVYPEHPHHRPSAARSLAMPGMLVGGPDEYLEDDCARELLGGAPPAKCYVDDLRSYSTNEIAIYWNSPLVYVLSRLGWFGRRI